MTSSDAGELSRSQRRAGGWRPEAGGTAATVLVATLVLLGACANPPARVAGRIPENPTRERNATPAGAETAAVQDKPTRAELLEKHDATTHAPTLEAVDPNEARIGVAGTHVFHRAKCKALEGVPNAERVRFVSAWDALDGEYRPCEECRPAR